MFSKSSIVFVSLALTSSVFAVDTTSTYLPNIVNAITTGCATTCTPFENAITTCINKYSLPMDLATCSCSASFLSTLRDCAICEDAATPGGAQQLNYDGFYNQCVSAVLATGTPAPFAGQAAPVATAAAAGGVAPVVVAVTSAAPIVAATTKAVVASSSSLPASSTAVVVAASAKPTSAGIRLAASGSILAGVGMMVAFIL